MASLGSHFRLSRHQHRVTMERPSALVFLKQSDARQSWRKSGCVPESAMPSTAPTEFASVLVLHCQWPSVLHHLRVKRISLKSPNGLAIDSSTSPKGSRSASGPNDRPACCSMARIETCDVLCRPKTNSSSRMKSSCDIE